MRILALKRSQFLTFSSANYYYDNKMKRIAALLTLAFSFIMAAPAYAQPLCPPGNFANLCNLKPSAAGGVVGTVIEVLLVIAILVCLFFLLWGGVRWISSGGDKAKIASARSTLVAAVVGLIIALAAYFIVNIVLYFLTGKSLSTMTIPTLLQ